MAWFYPPLVPRVISYSGTFVNIQNDGEFPRGAWAYHDTLILNTAKKPLRIWLEVGGVTTASTRRRIRTAIARLANKYVWAQDAGHVERAVEQQTLKKRWNGWKRQ